MARTLLIFKRISSVKIALPSSASGKWINLLQKSSIQSKSVESASNHATSSSFAEERTSKIVELLFIHTTNKLQKKIPKNLKSISTSQIPILFLLQLISSLRLSRFSIQSFQFLLINFRSHISLRFESRSKKIILHRKWF